MAPPARSSSWPRLGALLALWAPYLCLGCRAPLDSPSPLCALCAHSLEPPAELPPHTRALWQHEGPLRQAIHRAKYGGDPRAPARLGALLAGALDAVPGVELVVPVPLHPRRLRERGYNQSERLAAGLGLPVAREAVERTRATPPQVGLGRKERERNVRGAFCVPDAGAVRGRRVLVLDDVVTTGATLYGVCEALREAGAREVSALALAAAPLDKAETGGQ